MKTIKDIAKELNLSPSSVSRALSDSPQISAETKKKVRDLVRKYDYKPNRNAQNLVNNNSYTIGYMIPDIADNFFSYSAFGVEEVLLESPYEISYYATQRSPKRVMDYLERAIEYRYSGIVITPDEWSEALIARLDSFPIPVVCLRRKTPTALSDLPFVDTDHTGGMAEVVEYLLSLGHREIAYIGFSSTIGEERKMGYLSATARHDLPQYFEIDPSAHDTKKRPRIGYETIERLLKEHPQITAVAASDDYLALGVLEYLQEQNIRVPEEISVSGFDDREIGGIYSTQITTMHQYQYEMGQQAAAMLLRMIENPRDKPSSLMLKARLIPRRTAGPRRA